MTTRRAIVVNGVKVTKPSFLLRPGDIITVRAKEKIETLYRSVIATGDSPPPVEWLSVDIESLRVTVQGLPGASDVSLPVNVNIVVEFMSR